MDSKYMNLAFKYAKEAFNCDEVPIGAVIVKDDEIIGVGYNMKEKNIDVCGHAEIIAIHEAEKKLNNWRLDGCSMYVTLDPCPMCASAIKQSRISHLYSACQNSFKDNSKILQMIFEVDYTNPSIDFKTNLCMNKSKNLLNLFFSKHRNKD